MRIRSSSATCLLALLLGGCSSSPAPSAAPPVPGETQIASGVTLLRGSFTPGMQPDGNTVVFEARDGLVVVDAGRHRSHTQRIVDHARRSSQPVSILVNTHWHLDHVGGNALLRSTFPGVKVVATRAIEDALKGFLADYRKQLVTSLEGTAAGAEQDRLRAELGIIDSGKALHPDTPLTRSGKRPLAGREFTIGVEDNAVSGGDVWLLDAATRVLVAGDLVTLPAPFFDTACPDGWQKSLEKIDGLSFTVLVPGHGPPMTHETFTRYRQSFDRLLACAASTRTNVQCTSEWIEGAGSLIAESERPLTASLLEYYLDQHLRTPHGRYCRDR